MMVTLKRERWAVGVLRVGASLLGMALVVACSDVGSESRPSPEAPRRPTPESPAAGSPVITSPAPSEPARSPSEGPPAVGARPNALVTRVVDGDTIEVRYRSRELTVRLIGIDAPETVAPGQPVECYGPAASAFTDRELEGRRVRLEFDVERIDRYGRTLAYVWRGDELFNETLVRRGYAFVTTYPPNVRYVDRFLSAQREARARERGVWGACVAPSSGDACDPAYPEVCIPPPPPDLDCADVPYRRFTVKPPDPHNFDSDHDGLGCET